MVVHEGWSRLPEHWRCAFYQAWAAYIAGTIPVGAVVVDPHGVIAAEARNRIFDAGAPPPGQLAGSWLAHAELNALAQIDAVRSRTAEGWAVYTTLEPCPLCAGAITMAFRGRITVGYASGDPLSGGGLQVLRDTAMGRRRQWQVQRLHGPFAVFAEVLHAVYTVETRPTSRTAAFYREPPWRPLIATAQQQFQLDAAALHDLKDELLYAHPEVRDDAGRGLIWSRDTGPVPAATTARVGTPALAPLAYTPPYLAEKILTSRSALEGERKYVTILFAALKGSTALIADRDPEEARQLLDAVLERMIAAVHRYEGTVNQIMGDGIMALFGAPLAHEDHAVRACYAALAMQATLRRYSEEVRRTQGVALHFRVGLNAGEVAVRAISNDLHMDYSAIGPTVHLAARMEQLATPGSIFLTAATFRLVEGLVQVQALGLIPVKGLTDPVEVYELVGPVHSRAASRPAWWEA